MQYIHVSPILAAKLHVLSSTLLFGAGGFVTPRTHVHVRTFTMQHYGYHHKS